MSCSRRRAKAIARRENIARAATWREENRAFFEHGTTPASASSVSVCSCGAQAFTRDPHGFSNEEYADFDSMHAYCGEEF